MRARTCVFGKVLLVMVAAAGCSVPEEHTGQTNQALTGPDAAVVETTPTPVDQPVAGPTVATDKIDYQRLKVMR